MQIITNLEDLDAKIAECNDTLTNRGNDALLAMFKTFRVELGAHLPPDPFSPAYRDFQLALHARITGKPYSTASERTLFDVTQYRDRPWPYYTESTMIAGNHLRSVGFMLRALDLPPGARIVEFGPGWGSTTMELARLGFRVTTVDIEPNFCQMLRDRAEQNHVEIDVVEADFFWAENVAEPFDAAIFFGCFHHCDDHLRLLRALRTALKPDGTLMIASEPITHDFPMPWGVRMDGESLWAMRNFGWLELGFREPYFDSALARTGWQAQKHYCADPDWATVWVAHRADPAKAGPAPPPNPSETPIAAAQTNVAPAGSDPVEAALANELRAVYASTSWRITTPLRALRRLLG